MSGLTEVQVLYASVQNEFSEKQSDSQEVDLLNNLISSESYFELSTSPLSIKASYLRGKNERN